jgi:hypothetical protein
MVWKYNYIQILKDCVAKLTPVGLVQLVSISREHRYLANVLSLMYLGSWGTKYDGTASIFNTDDIYACLTTTAPLFGAQSKYFCCDICGDASAQAGDDIPIGRRWFIDHMTIHTDNFGNIIHSEWERRGRPTWLQVGFPQTPPVEWLNASLHGYNGRMSFLSRYVPRVLGFYGYVSSSDYADEHDDPCPVCLKSQQGVDLNEHLNNHFFELQEINQRSYSDEKL